MTTNSPAPPRAARVLPRASYCRCAGYGARVWAGLLALVSVPALTPACSSVRRAGEAPADSRALVSLNAAEERALCEAQNELVARDPDYLEATCAAKGAVVHGGNPARCEAERARCLEELTPACDLESPPPYRMIAEAVDCPKLTVGMLLMCNRANAPRAKRGYADINCDSDADEVEGKLAVLLDQQVSDPADGCEAALDACPGLRMSF